MFENLERKINNLIEKNLYPGMVVKIDQDGKEIFHKAFGFNDIKKKIKMEKDTIFPIYSTTKLITVVGAFLLIQEGNLNIDESVSKFYPKFNNDITIRNLMNMTSGVTYNWNAEENKSAIISIEKLIEEDSLTIHEIIDKLSDIPTKIIPGSEWVYGMNTDILGGIIEKVSNLKLSDYLREKIFTPLKMFDTDFKINDLKRKAIKHNLFVNNEENILIPSYDFHWLMPEKLDEVPNCCLGGSGVFSTAKDYNKFLNFLLDGKIDGKVVLEKKYLNEITSNQISHLKDAKVWDFNSDYSYGYSVRVRTKNELYPLTEIGEWGWDGILGNSTLVDPLRKLTMTLMVSVFPANNILIQTEIFEALYKDFSL
ncbi:serine hydrolase domain-containing protein [Spiroplasma monobiae]|uniref:Beta-lactamase-related domain-containing protein n=1 Tax=Spiroplasma monobiae MQ-1 TaxID=1336748 RepID=A0A2K9LU82_SPISQ|nr:serine hydrolase domain-containing protein [Spiroplasma monobiae]AUM62580.1 hypothetical protein SMONO_v1c03310 [Spiroplasma monobiae MQ-1]